MQGHATVLFSINSSTFNAFAIILKQNNLMGSNCVDWKRNLNIVLTTLGYKYVITTPFTEQPKWIKDDEMIRCYMQASMSTVLQHQHRSFKTISDIIMNLKEMFGDQGRPARQVAMRILMSTKMAEGTVQAHSENDGFTE